MIAFTVFTITIIWARVRLELAETRLAAAEQDAIELGLDTRTET
ncbi:MAG: hypothetical protein U0235_34315 [Polyangiaceae bacterium]